MLAGCALRPLYRDLVPAGGGAKEVKLQLVDKSGAGRPIVGAKVELGEGKNRVSTTSGADGTFTVPGTLTDNAVFVVTLPAGVEDYRLVPAPLPAPAVVVPAVENSAAPAPVSSEAAPAAAPVTP